MFGFSARILVLCTHPGRLLIYSAILNYLGFFRMTLCSEFSEAQRACSQQRSSFDLFLLDDLTPDIDYLLKLEAMSRARAFENVVLVSNVVDYERYRLFEWAWEKHVGLLDVIAKPLSITRLRKALDGLLLAPGTLH
ncbi:response regulator [Pseudomonas sp. PDNC002]|uniref:response regulator n=1 Tax=Pseudomonas sp. PDNC002 TaxID=2811422 RepID=UPI001962AC9D|nr:response regulator [Pseudomonas sp. PDNC002]QRY77766.1 response regulator [Pseudomonas sp. PDNC002]